MYLYLPYVINVSSVRHTFIRIGYQLEDLHKQKEFTKAMEGPGGYFLESDGYIVDKRNIKDQPKSVS
jgi:hypothetical protein